MKLKMYAVFHINTDREEGDSYVDAGPQNLDDVARWMGEALEEANYQWSGKDPLDIRLKSYWSSAEELAAQCLPSKAEAADGFRGVLQKTDWALLRQQKLTLIQVATRTEGKEREDIEGLLGWLDYLQDLAADHPDGLGAKAVFGKSEE